jgi:hypothetical protein
MDFAFRQVRREKEVAMFFFQEGFTYRNFLMDVLGIFFFVVWFWLLIIVFADLFRRHDISGWIKATSVGISLSGVIPSASMLRAARCESDHSFGTRPRWTLYNKSVR